jgi:hypothetical protein
MNMVVDKTAGHGLFQLALPDQSLELLQVLKAVLALNMVQVFD